MKLRVQQCSDGIIVRPDAVSLITRADRHNAILTHGIGINLVKYLEMNPVTPNDAGDADTGPNDLLNFPVITGEASPTVTGTACALCTVELFRADADPSGYGEADLWLKDVTADGTGQFSASICGVGLALRQSTASHGRPGNTSGLAQPHDYRPSGPCPAPTATHGDCHPNRNIHRSPTPTSTATPR